MPPTDPKRMRLAGFFAGVCGSGLVLLATGALTGRSVMLGVGLGAVFVGGFGLTWAQE